MTEKLLYSGSSMNPLFRKEDVVEILPCDGAEIRVGDVVTFVPPGQAGKVIHRVAAVTPRGIVTRGDNVAAADNWLLAPREILGKAVAIHRRGQVLPVPRSAPAGLYFLRVRRWFDRILTPLLHPVYRWLSRSDLFRGRLGTCISPRLLCFPRADGFEWQLWLGSLLVGRKSPHLPYWTIRRPFRLIVDEASLPSGPPGSAAGF